MPLDTRILLMGQPAPIENHLDNVIKANQPYNAMMENRLTARKLQMADAEGIRANRLASILQASTDPKTGLPDQAKLKQGLAQAGMYSELQDAQKSDLEQQQQQRLAQDSDLTRRVGIIDYGLKKLGLVQDQSSLDSLRAEMNDLHQGSGDGLPQIYSPEAINETAQKAMSVKDRLMLGQQQQEFGYKQQHDYDVLAQQDKNAQASLAESRRSHDIQQQANNIQGGKANFEAEQKLSADYQAESKSFLPVRDAYSRIKESLVTAHDSAPATLSAATMYMKMLDPNSVVRESELGMALNATGIWDKAMNYANMIENGQTLTKQQVAEFGDMAKKLYGAAEKHHGGVVKQYTNRAKDYGLDPSHVVTDYTSTMQGDNAQHPQQPVRTQTNKRTGQKRQSTDGGLTWQVIN